MLQQYPLDCGSLQFGTILYKVYRKKNCVAVLLRYNIGQLKLWIMRHSVCSYIKRDAINHLSLTRKQTLRCNTPSFLKHCLKLVLSSIHDIWEKAADSPEHQNTDRLKKNHDCSINLLYYGSWSIYILLLFNNNHSSSQPHSAKANLLRCQEEKGILFNMQFI